MGSTAERGELTVALALLGNSVGAFSRLPSVPPHDKAGLPHSNLSSIPSDTCVSLILLSKSIMSFLSFTGSYLLAPLSLCATTQVSGGLSSTL